MGNKISSIIKRFKGRLKSNYTNQENIVILLLTSSKRDEANCQTVLRLCEKQKEPNSGVKRGFLKFSQIW